MLRTFTAAALALSLIAGPAFAQGNTAPAPTGNAPMSQPAKTDANKSASVKSATKAKVRHARHHRHHVKHVKVAKHGKHIKHAKDAKGVKQPAEKTRG